MDAIEYIPGSGVPEFLGMRGENSALERARFLVLPVPYEQTTTYMKGTFHGPRALLEASPQLELYDEELDQETWRAGIHTLPLFPSDEPAALFFPKLTARVAELAALTGKTLFVVGGEHSLTQATVPAYAAVYPRLSVLHFDAHADLRAEHEGTPYSHACALYPASMLCRVVQVGVRSIGVEERGHVDHGNVVTFRRHAHRDVHALIRRVLRALTDDVYVSIDLDGFDPAVIPGVGTPQPGGFGWDEGLALFRAVFSEKHVVGVDVMELRPLPDQPLSEFAAAKLLYRLMGYCLLGSGTSATGPRRARG
jgi:agmatinase